MLQQTQVEQVIPYYRRFLKRFPTLRVLAQAPLAQVLDLWAGLGYYSRARNLHAAAQKVLKEHAGQIPDDPAQLLKLPGVGRYTAGAVASIAFGRPTPVLDGNVTRVLCRYFAIRKTPSDPAVSKRLWKLAADLIPKKGTGTFNQALMDLGALICTPRSPQCGLCPLAQGCRARRLGLQEVIPPRRRSVPRKRIRYVCAILEMNGSVLIGRRPFSGLLAGLWEFPGGEKRPGESDAQGLRRNLKERLGLTVKPDGFKVACQQTLTHRELEIRGFTCGWSGDLNPRWYQELRWIPKGMLGKVPFSAGMQKIQRTLLERTLHSERSVPERSVLRLERIASTERARFKA